jgi:hypothetical protein
MNSWLIEHWYLAFLGGPLLVLGAINKATRLVAVVATLVVFVLVVAWLVVAWRMGGIANALLHTFNN